MKDIIDAIIYVMCLIGAIIGTDYVWKLDANTPLKLFYQAIIVVAVCAGVLVLREEKR